MPPPLGPSFLFTFLLEEEDDVDGGVGGGVGGVGGGEGGVTPSDSVLSCGTLEIFDVLPTSSETFKAK